MAIDTEVEEKFTLLTQKIYDFAARAGTVSKIVSDRSINAENSVNLLVPDNDLDLTSTKAQSGIAINQLLVGSKNLIDKTKIRAGFYVSPSFGGIKSDIVYRCTGFIPVIPGQLLSLSGCFAPYIGGFTDANDTDYVPISIAENGGIVPENVNYVVCNITNTGGNDTSYDDTCQLEIGSTATEYKPYQTSSDDLRNLVGSIVDTKTQNINIDIDKWYKFTSSDEGAHLSNALPNYQRKWKKRDSDLTVVMTGTSLTARSTEHHTAHINAAFRPPLMHSNNIASILWDRIIWDGQKYARYDSGLVTENSGAWETNHNLSQWDDGNFRDGLTRYSESIESSISCSVPAGAYAFNYIYRSDTVSSETIDIEISEGFDQMEVYDGSSWVEANGYTFSQREPTPIARSVVVPSPDNDVSSTTISIPSKGNTTYQKRLKFRCKGTAFDSIATEKTITITKNSTGRFAYWGFEWSPRAYMVTLINAARGSHNTQANLTNGLPRFQDNEIWGFKPDLMLFELPIHNDGASNANAQANNKFERLTNNYVFRDDYQLSMKARSENFGLDPEMAMYDMSISWNFGGINDDGSLKYIEQTDGRVMTALDKYSEAAQWVSDNHPESVYIHAAQRWVDAAIAIFGDLRSATEGSGKDGMTFTNEGSHLNDTGSKIMAKVILPVINAVHSSALPSSAEPARRIQGDLETLAAANAKAELDLYNVMNTPGKNLANIQNFRRGYYVSGGSQAIVPGSTFRCTGFIPITPGVKYYVSGVRNGASGQAAAFFTAKTDTSMNLFFSNAAGGVTAPAGAQYLVVNITNNSQDDTSYDSAVQVESGDGITAYEQFYQPILQRPFVVANFIGYDNDVAAGTAGVLKGRPWKTSATNTLSLPAGVLMIKT